jgi:hypothetical protein
LVYNSTSAGYGFIRFRITGTAIGRLWLKVAKPTKMTTVPKLLSDMK